MRAAYALLFLSAYLTALLVCPHYDPTALPSGLRLLLLACGGAAFVGGTGFLLSFRTPPEVTA